MASKRSRVTCYDGKGMISHYLLIWLVDFYIINCIIDWM